AHSPAIRRCARRTVPALPWSLAPAWGRQAVVQNIFRPAERPAPALNRPPEQSPCSKERNTCDKTLLPRLRSDGPVLKASRRRNGHTDARCMPPLEIVLPSFRWGCCQCASAVLHALRHALYRIHETPDAGTVLIQGKPTVQTCLPEGNKSIVWCPAMCWHSILLRLHALRSRQSGS